MGLSNNLGKLSNMITSTGSAVGIAQASPAYTLDVSGTLRNTTSAYFATASGNVGIGTTTATNKLTITNDGNAANALRINDTNANASFLSLSASNTDAAIIANGTAAIPLDIYTGGSARVRVSATGNVGIGTTSPVSTNLAGSLTIVKSYSGDTPTSTTAQNYYNNQSNLYLFGRNAGLTMVGNTNEECIIAFASPSSDYLGAIRYETQSTSAGGAMKFQTGGATERMRINAEGKVLIGKTSDDTYRLQVEAAGGGNQISLSRSGANAEMFMGGVTGAATTFYIQANASGGVYLTSGATSWTGNSDERLKNITGNIENAIDSLLTLRTVKHTWKSDDANKEHLALIAQDVEAVFPQVIDKSKINEKDGDETEYLGVRYTELIPVLVKAVQELSAQNQDLKSRLDKAGL